MEAPVNKVEAAGLLTLDLGKLLPIPEVAQLDLAQFLEEGLLLREKPFRAALRSHDWQVYTGKLVVIALSTDAIIPPWAYLLVGMYLQSHAVYYGVGSEDEVIKQYQLALMDTLDWEAFRDKKILLKGCASISPAVMTEFFRRAMPIAQLIFYGEACSSVPVYKRK
ncbi:MAG: DUF2480 family protein [Bacteroidia bacterium]|nr:DUF2480 family protein [Bacteroidia bacterium]MCX7651510.1 DUF2480 family protein [Bacteroidia bacterium]MDW8416807.1 DUF2480 family protein [Bacteroidia bacterium]